MSNNLERNPLRHCLTGDTSDIVDYLIGDFLLERCMGRNDMAVINGLLATAAIMLAVHCQRTGQDFDETFALLRDSFDRAAHIAYSKSK